MREYRLTNPDRPGLSAPKPATRFRAAAPLLQIEVNPSLQVTAFFSAALENARYQRYFRHKVRPKSFADGLPFRVQQERTSRSMSDFTDVTYEVEDGLAWITINRPDR
ncbi:MAG: hypothetical protein EOP32_27565, partial [Rhodococcus sp. (in: high G+C Gram-positive bacteria)]